jgi:hypothetical protein
MVYTIPIGRQCDITNLNVHIPIEVKIDDVKDSFYEDSERILVKFPKHHTKSFSRNFNAEVRREDIFKPTVGIETFHQN